MFELNKYNYQLNGIEHEILLGDHLKIDRDHENEKILVSNKYLLKYVNDLFDFHSIEYCILGDTLLGQHVFNGINIFSPLLEIGINNNYIYKLIKIKDDIINDGNKITYYDGRKKIYYDMSVFDSSNNDNNNNIFIKISSRFFDNIVSSIYIYLFNTNNNAIEYYSMNNKIINFNFYDIFPIKKILFEEFNISVPNKIENILQIYNINLNSLSFKKDSNKKNQIIEELTNNKKEVSLINKITSIFG
jgi:hypothetical protein